MQHKIRIEQQKNEKKKTTTEKEAKKNNETKRNEIKLKLVAKLCVNCMTS